MVSAKMKFIVMTIDELVLLPIAFILVYFFIPELLAITILLGIVGAAIFVAIKYYLVFPSLLDESAGQYDLHGLTGRVISTITEKSGKIKVGQEIWDARTKDGPIEEGAEVIVVSRESMKVNVTRKEE